MMLDFAECDRARLARDPSYDGRFFTGVRTTGVYCRPVCPVRKPLSKNVSFFPSAAAAELAGFRPCLRCRPETAPFSPAWKGTRATVDRAVRLIIEECVGRRFGGAAWGGGPPTDQTVHPPSECDPHPASEDGAGSARQTLARLDRPSDDRRRHAGGLSQPSPFQRCLRRGLSKIPDRGQTICQDERTGSASRKSAPASIG